MDTGRDFIQPEFLNILFFRQKNLVIFPYVDLKHLYSLEAFTAGHRIIEFEGTAINDLRGIIEYESLNSYSQSPSIYLCYNLDKKRVKEVMNIEGIRCIINTKFDVRDLANGSDFIFYNKKNMKFINFDKEVSDLSFERYLIDSSENVEILHTKIQNIKLLASRFFLEINKSSNVKDALKVFGGYDQKYWSSLLDFVKYYYNIKLPDMSEIELPKLSNKPAPSKLTRREKDFSEEYVVILDKNKVIAKEFIQLLHKYRREHVNPSNLDLEQLYNPLKLFNYLRNNHWKREIPKDFIIEWLKMTNTRYILSNDDLNDFQVIFKHLGISDKVFSKLISDTPDNSSDNAEDAAFVAPKVKSKHSVKEEKNPSVSDDFVKFKSWILDLFKKVEDLI